MKRKILITGGTGFIGYHLSKKLLKDNYEILGIDNVNDYYDPQLKEDRLNEVKLFEVNAEISKKDHEIIYIYSKTANYNKINNNLRKKKKYKKVL